MIYADAENMYIAFYSFVLYFFKGYRGIGSNLNSQLLSGQEMAQNLLNLYFSVTLKCVAIGTAGETQFRLMIFVFQYWFELRSNSVLKHLDPFLHYFKLIWCNTVKR